MSKGNHNWEFTILRWPYFGTPQEEAGKEKETVQITADDVSDALHKAKLYQRGVESSPKVWQAPIVRLEQVR